MVAAASTIFARVAIMDNAGSAGQTKAGTWRSHVNDPKNVSPACRVRIIDSLRAKAMQVTLRRNKDKFIRRGYPWVFRNQIHRVEGEPASGAAVAILSADGTFLGQGLYHAESQIAVRLVTQDPGAVVNAEFFCDRLRRAIAFRSQAFSDATHVRLVYGESDGIPGTVIDRYGSAATWSCLAFGIEQHREAMIDTLVQETGVTHVVERNDNVLRPKDGLEERTGLILRGDASESVVVEIEENGVRYRVDVVNGAKTGFFIDQRLHRQHIRRYADKARVLDAFCSDGGFGLQAAHAGAQSVDMIDVSSSALARARDNARLNGLEDRVNLIEDDAINWLARAADDGKRYDLIILDPPAFAKRRRDIEDAERAYQSININAFRLLEPGGILATSSCSQALDEDTFHRTLRYASKRSGRPARMLFRGCHPPDHPVLDSMPETSYLKFFVYQVTDS